MSLSSRQQLGAAAILLALSALVSRFMGLVRDKVISWQFGAGAEADMYFAAFVVPDIINYLLAGGFLSITIIPLLSKEFARDEDSAWGLFSCVGTWMFAGSLFFTLLAASQAHWLARLVAPGFSPEQSARLAFFMRLVLPAQVFFLSGACFTALLYLRRQFRVPALAPLIYNACIILCGLALPGLARASGLAADDFGMTGYCLGASLGALLGALVLPAIVAARGGLKLRPRLSHPLMGRFLLAALPLMLGQTVIMLDEQFLRVFGSQAGEGAVSLLNYARRIAQVPAGIMGQAAAAASFPFLVALITANDREKLDATLNRTLGTCLCLGLMAAIYLMACARPVMDLLFGGGRFGLAETLACVPLARLMLAATPALVFYMVLVRAFYAGGDTITPAVTGTVITVLVLPVYQYWAVCQGTEGIAIVSSVSVSIYVLWLAMIWARRHGRQAFAGLGRLCLRALAASLPAAWLCWWLAESALPGLAKSLLPDISSPLLEQYLVAGICLALASLAFGLAALPPVALLLPELRAKILARLMPRLPGSRS